MDDLFALLFVAHSYNEYATGSAAILCVLHADMFPGWHKAVLSHPTPIPHTAADAHTSCPQQQRAAPIA